ncbi:MAG: glutaredoxin 3 [Pseudomonadota bacterium]
MSDTPAIVMYSNQICPYCGAARMLLKQKGVEFTDIPVAKDTPVWDEMIERSGRRTVPQIFIGETHVGGFDDLYELDKSGKLDSLLAV